MNFPPINCYIMSITLKRQPSSYSYTPSNTPLEGVTFQKYFRGLHYQVTQLDLKKKANEILGVLQRNMVSCSPVVKGRAYLTLVRPVCEYGSVAWSPYPKTDINCLESVQRCATHFVCNDYRRISSVYAMISNLAWQDLETRRRISVVMLSKDGPI